MGAQAVRPQTLEEHIVYWTIVSTYGLYLLGALYITGSIIGYVLLAIFAARWLGLRDDHPKRPVMVPMGIMIWVLSMLAMLVALVIAHFDFELGMGQTIKSAVGWAKGWALMAVVPLAGALLSIRAALVYRALSHLALQSLLLAPLFYIAGQLGLPHILYVSPLSVIGGGAREFFEVTLYAIDVTGVLRWYFFSPWATAAAFFSGLGILIALYEKSWFWLIIGTFSSLLVCYMSGSRAAIIAVPFVICAVFGLTHLHRPVIWIGTALAATVLVLVLDPLLNAVGDAKDAFDAARAESSRVRATLNSIGYERWLSEAFWFGHGTVQPGSLIVQRMPIGSHHTWYGLLFVKGIVGFVALAIPMAWTVVVLALKSQCDRVARCGLAITLAIFMFSFADNIEIVMYLLWPALLIVGIALRRPLRSPYVQPFRGLVPVGPAPRPALGGAPAPA